MVHFGQSEPVPMTTPAGHSVHRDGLCFSSASLPYVNQRSTTVNLFWLLSFDHCF
jgi:hypothetical protein